jgi:hypothetical protein
VLLNNFRFTCLLILRMVKCGDIDVVETSRIVLILLYNMVHCNDLSLHLLMTFLILVLSTILLLHYLELKD